MGAAKATAGRRIALDILLECDRSGAKSGDIIKAALDKYDYLEQRDKAFIRRLSEGCIERAITLDYIIDLFASTKTSKMKAAVRIIMRMGVYQLMYMDNVPDAAACNESVSLAVGKGFSGLRGFINGVLRNISRNKASIAWPDKEKDVFAYLSVKYSMPLWIVKKIYGYYGSARCENMLDSYQRERDISVNILKGDKRELTAAWEKSGVRVSRSPYLDNAFLLGNVPGVSALAGFYEGSFIVQDSASMLAVKAAGIKEGDTVIDLCAAPGGKSIYAASMCGSQGRVYAFDLSEAKAERIKENAGRVKADNIIAAVHDATVFDPELEDKADVLIADLPCSGLGVMGRKADIRYRLKEDDICALARLQRDILKNAASYVKPGGVLMYSTCTVSREENEDNRKWFIDNFDFEALGFAERMPQAFKESTASEGYLQLICGEPEGMPLMDGFFISLFRRRS